MGSPSPSLFFSLPSLLGSFNFYLKPDNDVIQVSFTAFHCHNFDLRSSSRPSVRIPLHCQTTQASQAERSSPYTPASARLQAEICAEWNQYFTDANFRVFCCLVCSERVFGHEAQWVAKSVLKCRDRGILEVLTDVHLRSDLRPTTYNFEEWRAAIIDPRGLHRRNDLEGQPIYFATDESSVRCSVCPGCYQSLFTCKSCAY